jgi:hypothetical protein
MLKFVYEYLLGLQERKNKKKSNQMATAYGINDCLQKIFKNKAYILNPELSTICSPTEPTTMFGIANYVQEMKNIIKKDDGELKKPIIAI